VREGRKSGISSLENHYVSNTKRTVLTVLGMWNVEKYCFSLGVFENKNSPSPLHFLME